MTREIRRIDPLRFANVMAVVYAAIFIVFVVIMAPFVLMAPALQSDAGETLPQGFLLALLVIYPIMGAVMGWGGGLILAAVYNFVAQRMGGIRVEVSAEASAG